MKRTISLLAVAIVGVAVWYFLIKDYNYVVRFTANHNQGTIYSTINNWLLDKHPEIDSIATIDRQFPSRIVQEFYAKDSVFELEWNIVAIADTVSQVILRSKDLKNRFKQNLEVIYKKNNFVARSIDLAQNLNKGLIAHAEDYKITPKEATSFPETFCACVNAKATVFTKANSMMQHINSVMGYINRHDIELVGDPLLQVLKWDKVSEEIEYDFCFPIEFNYQLPPSKNLIFKTVGPFKALRTDFNGNYRISDRAWYSALNTAKRDGQPVIELPVEVYRNDPHVGAGELDWVAEVYLPLK